MEQSFARIAELRRNAKESLQDVADAVGVTKTHFWELERGRSANPSFTVIKGLADHLPCLFHCRQFLGRALFFR
ncbi:helix-turn-helix domain-containing protein [Mesorhizobium sp. NBSH29]|nr:helix-turn-helix domain-containing protein [Mesorhizobium sp. NBSH29]